MNISALAPTLAQTYGTPLYVYDFDGITTRFNQLKNAFRARKSIIAYAVKANSNLSTLAHMAKLGAGADCVSIGEVKRALLAGIPKYQIIFSGVGKQDEEIRQALEADILFINIESEAEMYRIEQVAQSMGKVARLSVRVNPNIDAKTHPYISTGLQENKFGVDIETAKRIYLYIKNSPVLEPVGIHFHIGSQLTQLEPIREAAVIVANLVRTLQAVKIELKFFDIGGGIGVVYSDETTIDPVEYAQAILSTMMGLDMTIICEPGRYIVANNGYLLTRVLYEKMSGARRFVVIDGAMNDLLRPSLYKAYHRIEAVERAGEPTNADVVGPVCESGDFLGKNVPLPPMQHNDILVVHSAGAYGFSMASNYNTRGRAAEVAIEGDAHRLIRARESFEDMIANESKYL
ncbi:MAG: diaminopimelate decarboxylase [Sulfuricurvum sp. PC08-66]|nr:MAG: diaminopimelate decarboxylase [Sulfuricurvum sp. PC08-66]